MLRFYFCRNVEKQLKGQSYENMIRAKFAELQNRKNFESIRNLHDYGGKLYVLKTFTPFTRIIIEESIVDNIKGYFIRDIIKTKDGDFYYTNNIHPKLKNGEWLINNPLSEEDKDGFQSHYKEEEIKQNDKKMQSPPESITAWLSDYRLHIESDIFEAEEWVNYTLNDSINEGMQNIHISLFRLLLNDLVNNNPKINQNKIKEENGISVFYCTSNNVGIIYSKIKTSLGYNYVLLNGAHIIDQKKYWENSIVKIRDNNLHFNSDVDSICRFAYRAYPSWTISNERQWFAIQMNDEMSNLSLTQEQIIFFKEFSLPYYINGQAGSGKSTMLYYLFAHARYLKCMGYIGNEIIFLTENTELLEHTRKAVFDLLSNNPQFDGLTIQQRLETEKYFVSFKEFLVQLLPEEDRYDFNADKYLNFSVFKNLYEDSYLPKHVKKLYTAEESWFTIITYIYGYDSSRKITSEEYLDTVYRDSKKIPKDKFMGIEKYVLPFYERLIEDYGYWDKLKIIRYIDNNIDLSQNYSLIICDEAQDFCRVELQFILRMSEFFQYDLTRIVEVPIIFAGDPNQTVNPTGFRQSEMTEMLHNELKEVNFEYKPDKSVYNPIFNYRSSQSVVTLANCVQYFRKKSFDIKLIKPQIAKRLESAQNKKYNVFFDYVKILEDQNLQIGLIEKMKFKIFIVPVDSNEKDAFILDNAILSLIKDAEIKTSIEAKGAEYQQVVLYGFGDYYIKNFKNLDFSKSENENDVFRQRYFFNKLYVGLTRARTELIIIDSKESENSFWKKIVNSKEISDIHWENVASLVEGCIQYNPGTLNNVLDSTPELALENAIKDKEQGIYDNNSARLRIASNQFFKIGNKEFGWECLAIAERIDGNWQKAGELYLSKELKSNKLEEASDCFFKGKLFGELSSEIGNKLKSNRHDCRLIISRLMKGEVLLNTEIDLLYNKRDELKNLFDDVDWRSDFLTRLMQNVKTNLEIRLNRNLVEILEVIAKDYDYSLFVLIGELHFKLRNYRYCINAWDRIDYIENIEYVQANIELAKSFNNYEDEILWIGKLLDYIDIEEQKIDIYNKIIQKHKEINILSSASIFYKLNVYKAALQLLLIDEIIIIGKSVESSSVENLNIIYKFYLDLLTDVTIKKKISEFILSRFAKIHQKISLNNLIDENQWIKEFNDAYQNIAKNKNLKFKPFKLDDFKEISDLPDNIEIYPPLHLPNISIKGFRRFKELTIENIGKFNLIVGDNNVGKTSLLEALLFTQNKELFFNFLVHAYADRCNLIRYLDDVNKEHFIISNNFIDSYINIRNEKNEIEYEIYNKRSSWNYCLRRPNISELHTHFSVVSGIDINDYYCFDDNSSIDFIELSLLIRKVNPRDSVKTPFIPFGKGYIKDLAIAYSDEIDKKKSIRNSFIENMRVFIPNIERIVVDTENGDIGIEETGFEEVVPLNNYGEGANKLFRILVQITLQKGKNILIDEIDAGIHYSRFEKFWEVILEFSQLYDTQIFATTHNLECIKYFNDILNNDKFEKFRPLSRVITLHEIKENNTIKAFTRNFNEFGYELTNNFEIRGGEL